jgi:hypothetical protein
MDLLQIWKLYDLTRALLSTIKTSLPTRAGLHIPSNVNWMEQVSFFENG